MPKPVSPLKLGLSLLYLLMWPALFLWLAGDWRWAEGLLFNAWFVGGSAVTLVWLYINDPALLAERYRRPGSGGQSRRDQLVVYLVMVGFIAWIALMPLDARRYHWTPHLPWPVALSGCMLLALSSVFLFRAFSDNTFLSPLVRVQRERAHHVVTTGVYGVVRHPMYLGAAAMFLGGPLLVGAASALGVGIALIVLLMRRIRDEEAVLTAELPGYAAYREQVRYRLVPRIW